MSSSRKISEIGNYLTKKLKQDFNILYEKNNI